MPELDAPTEAIPTGVTSSAVDSDAAVESWRADPAWVRWVMWCRDHEYVVVSVVVGSVLLLAAILSVANSGSSSKPVEPPKSSYEQGYAYGQRLDNQGYGSDEAYQACRGRVSQQQDDIGTFQFACDVGYAQ